MENFIYAGKCLENECTLFKFHISEEFLHKKTQTNATLDEKAFLVVVTSSKYKVLAIDDIEISFIINGEDVFPISLTRIETAKLIKSIQDFIQLRSLMLFFNYNGVSKSVGDWQITRGGDTLLWTLKYKGKRVIDCVLNELQNAGLNEFAFRQYAEIIMSECIDCFLQQKTSFKIEQDAS